MKIVDYNELIIKDYVKIIIILKIHDIILLYILIIIRSNCKRAWFPKISTYIVYQGRKVGFFRPSVLFAVRVEGEQARAEGECVLRAEDDILQPHEVKEPT